MKLPLIHSTDTELNLIQTKWKSLIDPILGNPLIDGRLIKGVNLINGTTIINHLLGRDLVGYIIVGINGIAEIFDNQASNQTPDLTLSLTSNAAVTVNLWVF